MCFHIFVDGFGLMGDALTCIKCNYSKYPEALKHKWIYQLLGRIIKNCGEYRSYNTFPYVRRKDKDK